MKYEDEEIIAVGPRIGMNFIKFKYRKIKDIKTIQKLSNDIFKLGDKWQEIKITTYPQFYKEFSELLDKHSKILNEKEPCEEVIFELGFIKKKFTKKKGGFLNRIKDKLFSMLGEKDEKRL